MAKVSLSIKSLNSTDFKEDKVQKLESNDIPFEINDGKIYLISRGTVDVQSRIICTIFLFPVLYTCFWDN